MATKKLFASGITGTVVIHDAPTDEPITDPIGNYEHVYFHSDLEYMSVVQVMTGSLSLPARIADGSDASTAYGSAVYVLGSHNLGYTPIILGWSPNFKRPLAGDTLIFGAGNASLRSVVLGADQTNVYLREIYLNKDVSAPAVSLEYLIWVFEEAAINA